MQIYEKVAAAYKGEKDVVIAKLDADAHGGLGEKYVLLPTFQISSLLSMVVFVDPLSNLFVKCFGIKSFCSSQLIIKVIH